MVNNMDRAQYESVEVPYALAGSPDKYNRGKMQVYTIKIKEYFEKHNEEEIMFHTYNLEYFPHVMTIEELAEFMDRNCYVLPDDNGGGKKMKFTDKEIFQLFVDKGMFVNSTHF